MLLQGRKHPRHNNMSSHSSVICHNCEKFLFIYFAILVKITSILALPAFLLA